MRGLIAALAVASLCAAICGASISYAAPVPPGGTWHDEYITEPDGTKLHVDVVRPAGLRADAKTPVILSVGPYFSHAGHTGALCPVEECAYTPLARRGPSDRFNDFVIGARLLQRGYTWVMVDLRGYGGSSGCQDWGGPDERADVNAAVEWAASQPWSTGKVGMYGKSSDAATGLEAAALRPKGLAAVVANEPVFDFYGYLYMNRIQHGLALGSAAVYAGIAATPGPARDTPAYIANDAPEASRPGCPALGITNEGLDTDPHSSFWRRRDLPGRIRGTTVPVFMTEGFLEDNTTPAGAFDLFNSFAGFKRAWFGMWDHVRGNDRDATGRLAMGRATWFDEVMRFFDHFVAGVPLADAPTDQDPPVVVETSDGTWRSETSWPPADSRGLRSSLRAGSYRDDAQNNGTGSGAGTGVWTISPPLTTDAHMAGIPRVDLNVTHALPRANLTVDVYDIDAGLNALLISRGTYLLRGAGRVAFDLYGDDWRIRAGHRIGVLVTSSNAEWWTQLPTLSNVSIAGGSISLPFLAYLRTETLPGNPSIKLESYRRDAPFKVAAAKIAQDTQPGFALPPALQPKP